MYYLMIFYFLLYINLELVENHKCLSNDTDIKNILSFISNELNSQVNLVHY